MNTEPATLTQEWRSKLSEVFDNFEKWLGKGFEPRRKIDEVILKILGYDSQSSEKILKWLYPALLKEVYILKKMNRVDVVSS